jgi:hypothetical protein
MPQARARFSGCQPVRVVRADVGGRLRLDLDLTGRWQREFDRLKTGR